jgi:6-phosphofructokinase
VSGARASWRARVFGCVLAWLGTFCAFAVFANGTFENSDSVLTMHAARVLWQRGDSGLLMEGQGGDLLGERKGAEWITRVGSMGKIGAGGRAYVWFPMGHVWLLAPFTAIGARLDECWPGSSKRYGGIAEAIGREIAGRTPHEVRTLVLGHLQRGGTPTTYDRLVALRFGAAAVRCVEQGKFGTMVALDPPDIKAVPLEDAIRQIKTVPIHSDTVETARDLGISFGD